MGNVLIKTKSALTINGEQITDFVWDKCKTLNGYIVASSGDTIACYNQSTGKKIFALEGVTDFNLTEKGILVYKDNLVGLYSCIGRIIIPIKYKSVSFHYSVIIVRNKEDLFGIYSYGGKEIAEAVYDNVSLHNKVIEVRKGKLFGAISYNGDTIIPAVYDELVMSNDKIVVRSKDSYLVHDLMGKVIVPACDKVINVPNGIIAYENGRCGLYSNDGRLIVPVKYDNINVTESIKYIKVSHKLEVINEVCFGIYSTNGDVILNSIFEEITYGKNNTLIARIQGKYIIYSNKGEKILSEPYNEVTTQEDVIVVTDKYLCKGMYSYDGKELIPPRYTSFVERYSGILAFKEHGKYVGFYSKDYKMLIPPIYNSLELMYVKNRIFRLTKDSKTFFYFEEKNEIVEADNINVTKTGIIEIYKEGKWEVFKQ